MRKIKLQIFFFMLMLNHAAFSQIAKNEIDSIFNKSLAKIEGEGRSCHIINSFTGDLNNDKQDDVLIYYSCGMSGTLGNATTGGGWAIWLHKDGRLQYLLCDEKKFGLSPLQILPDGIINCDQLQYNSESSTPSVIGQRKVKLVKDSLVILK